MSGNIFSIISNDQILKYLLIGFWWLYWYIWNHLRKITRYPFSYCNIWFPIWSFAWFLTWACLMADRYPYWSLSGTQSPLFSSFCRKLDAEWLIRQSFSSGDRKLRLFQENFPTLADNNRKYLSVSSLCIWGETSSN